MTRDPDDESGSALGNLILVVIMIGFLIGLVPLATMVFGPAIGTLRALNWEPAEAVIASSFVDVPYRRQYRLETRYTYEWDGVIHSSDRVFFDDMVGVRKGYYHRVNRALLRHKIVDNPITVWVNPQSPSQAVIYPQMRWDKFAGNLFMFAIWTAITLALVAAVWNGPVRRR